MWGGSMTTYTGNVENGQATIQINTTGMKEGIYKVQTEYQQDYDYKRSTNESNLILQQAQQWTIIDCTDTTQFKKYNVGMTQNNAVLASDNFVNGEYYGKTALPVTVQRGMIIEASFNNTCTGSIGVFLSDETVNNHINQYNQYFQDRHNNTTVKESTITTIKGQSSFDVKFVINNDGSVTYTNSLGANETSTTQFTDQELSNMYFMWGRFQNNGYFSIHALKYKYV